MDVIIGRIVMLLVLIITKYSFVFISYNQLFTILIYVLALALFPVFEVVPTATGWQNRPLVSCVYWIIC